MNELHEHKAQVESFNSATLDNRLLQQRDRDYYDHKQYTDEELAEFRKRRQAPVINNRIKPKVEGLLGLYLMRKTDPKAYPRTQKHEDSAHAITDALRYVADNTDFDQLKTEVASNFFIEGVGGAIVQVKQNRRGEIDIDIEEIPWDRIYYDPHSRKLDFSDARYMGMVMWMGKDEVKEKFPEAKIDDLVASNADTVHEDRPQWIDGKNNRVKVSMHFYINEGVWFMHVFTDGLSLVEPVESPFLDEFGEPTNPIELVSANVDRDNNRYSQTRGFISQQDSINHRSSKFHHLMSHRQTFGRKGANKDVRKMKYELSKPDGHIEFEGEQFGKDFGVMPTGDMAQGQYQLLQEAKSELDSVSVNAQLAGERQGGNLSGKAIDRLQSAGTIELNREYNLLVGWEKRIYRQVWARIKQFWNEEKWIRITDDHDNLRWVGLNNKMTVQDLLEQTMEDEALPQEMRIGAAASYKQMTESQDPRLQEVVEVKNDTTELDADVMLEQSFDVVNVQQEQFQMLAQFAQGSDVDVIELIELSQIRGKEDLIEKIEKRRAAQQEAAGNIQALQAQGEQVKLRKGMADAAVTEQNAVQKKIENTLMIQNPDRTPQVSV